MKQRFQFLQDLFKLVWQEKWEHSLAFVGFIGSILATDYAWAQIFFGLIALVLLVDIGAYTRQSYQLMRRKNVPLMLAVRNQSDDVYRTMLNQVLSQSRKASFDEYLYQKLFRIYREDFVIRYDDNLSNDPAEWKKLVQKFESKLNYLNASLDSERIYHLFLKCPSTLAAGLGAITATHHRFILYYFDSAAYHPMLDFSSNSLQVLREKLPRQHKFRYLKISPYDPSARELYVSILLAGHDPTADVEALGQEHQIPVVHISKLPNASVNGGDRFGPEDDWLLICRELLHFLHGVQAGGRKLHLFCSMPIISAFVMGMGLGMMADITVYNFDTGETRRYHPVLKLNQLR